MSKKGQIEMIGLVIVVILLVIGLLFYVKFGIFREDVKKDDSAAQSAYVTNLMGAILNIKVCESAPIKIEQGIITCFNNEQLCGEEACSYLKEQIGEVIADIDLKSYKNYSIWITKGEENRTIINECKTGILAQTTIVAANREHYTTYFRLC